MAKISKTITNEPLEKTFVLENTNFAFVNELRRVATNQIPVMAIEDIYFTNNTSALYDEILAHRIGLIPLKTTPDYVKQEDCKCKGKGCASCRVKLKLNVKGPKKVYASDFKSTDPNIKPVNPKTLIVELIEGQEIELEAHAFMNTAEEHAKWNSCLAFYQGYPKITISNKADKKIAEICPKKVFEVKNNKLTIKNLEDCNLCKACEDKSNGEIKLSSEEDKFIFTLESWGQYPPKEILSQTTSIIKNKLKDAKIK